MFKILFIVTSSDYLLHHLQKSNNNYEVISIVKSTTLLYPHSLEQHILFLTFKIETKMIYLIYAYLNMKSNLLNLSKKIMLYK